MSERQMETSDGQIILLTDDYGPWAWVGCAGIFGPDELRDILNAVNRAERYFEREDEAA